MKGKVGKAPREKRGGPVDPDQHFLITDAINDKVLI